MNTCAIALTVNGEARQATVETRLSLADLLREVFRLTGTHLGCEHGVCGACTVLLDGEAVRSCLLLAVQADGHSVETVEHLAPDAEHLSPLQAQFVTHHGLQCGFCTPGFIMTATALLESNPRPSEEQIRKGLEGNLCRCTGYTNIVKALQVASAAMATSAAAPAAATAGSA